MARTSMQTLATAAAIAAATAVAGCGDRGETAWGPKGGEALLTVYASATTRSAPDLAIVTLGVIARGPSGKAATDAQAQRMTAVLAAVKAAGVEEKDVQTVQVALEPQYVYPQNASPRISGYESRNTVAIRVKKLDAVSGLIDAVVADGANQLQGVQFTYQDGESALDAARAKAVETARARASAYAKAAGMKVDRIVSITEPGGAPPPAPYGAPIATRAAAAEQAATPISPGEQDNASSVTVVFALR
jgi:uncharacterized protein